MKIDFKLAAFCGLAAMALMVTTSVQAESFDPTQILKQAGDAFNAAVTNGQKALRNFDPQKDNLILHSTSSDANDRVTKVFLSHCNKVNSDLSKMDNVKILIDNGRITVTDKTTGKIIVNKPAALESGYKCNP
jgi:hypothetical protein